MADPVTLFLAVATTYFAQHASTWLDALRGTLLDEGKEEAVEKGRGIVRHLLRLDEKEQQRHLELALKNAVERGLARFHTTEERDQYRHILKILFEPGVHSDTLRREALRLFTLSEIPNLAELNESYNRSLRTRTLSQLIPPAEVDATPYLSSFFEALIAELYIDPLFCEEIKDRLSTQAILNIQRSVGGMYRSLEEIVGTLHQINTAMGNNYTPEQFERDVAAYTAHIERSLRYLKLMGVVPKERGNENKDPELGDIFVPLRITLQDPVTPEEEKQDSVLALLENASYIVLLGGPGSGKSTIIRHLAWSHAQANLPDSSASFSKTPLLSGNPLPLRIELRRLAEDRRYHPDYSFLSYVTGVLLGREGVEINPQMFKELLERRAMLLLFDGLDEVATLDERLRLIKEIEGFALNYPGNRVLVISRPVGYELVRFSNHWFSQAQVQDFNDEQIGQFLERWYTHVLRLSSLPHDDQQELETLFRILKNNPRLHKLAVNPLLLTVITALHHYERLPDRRILIYDRCADLLLDTWAKLKGTNMRWKDMKMVKEDQYACVAHIGFVLHTHSQEKESGKGDSKKDGASDVPMRFMLREIERFLQSRKLITEVAEQRAEAKRLLELMQVEAGLIVERGTDENGEPLYGFMHRTFQEYFAAADVYECYQQDEDPAIISEFLKEHRHNPHWREVTLLLLGKLKRKPATAQLRLILEDKTQSSADQSSDVVQQDLFFVSSCLTEEIPVENELAESIVSRLSDVVDNSPFSSQRDEALQTLGSLLQTRQYTNLARKELVALITQNLIADISTKVNAAQILFQNSPGGSEERQLTFQAIIQYVQSPDFPPQQAIQEAQRLYRASSERSKEKQLAAQLLLHFLQRPDLPIEQVIQTTHILYQTSSEVSEQQRLATQLLFLLAQRSDLSVEQAIQDAEILYWSSPQASKEERLATQVLLHLAQRSDLSVKQAIQAAEALYQSSSQASEEQRLATQLLLQLTQRSGLSTEQVIQASQALYRSSPQASEARRLAAESLLRFA